MASNPNKIEPQQLERYKCKHCDIKPFTQKSHLNSHAKLKHNENESGKRKCIQCAAYFAQTSNFSAHYKKFHVTKGNGEKCEQCQGKIWCKKCTLDIEQAKITWQLQPLESDPKGSKVSFDTILHIFKIIDLLFRYDIIMF